MGTELYTPSSNSIIHNTKVDFTNRAIQKPINLVQYDRNMPIIAVSLYKNGLIYPLPVGVTVKIRWGKKDRTFVYKEALGCNTERNIIYIDVDEQMTYFHGKLDPIIELVDSSGSTPTIAGSSSIPVNIERNPIQEDYIQSSSEYIDLTQAVADAQAAQALAEQAAALAGQESDNAEIAKGQAQEAQTAAEAARDEAEQIVADVTVKKANRYIDEPIAELNNHTLREVFENRNIAMSDLTGKPDLGGGVYRFFDANGITADYNIYNGQLILNGSATRQSIFLALPETLFEVGACTIKYTYVSGIINNGSLHIDEASSQTLITRFVSNYSSSLVKTFNKNAVNEIAFYVSSSSSFTNLTFTIQIEKGTTATPYQVPTNGPYSNVDVGSLDLTTRQIDYWFNVYQQYKDDNGLKSTVDSLQALKEKDSEIELKVTTIEEAYRKSQSGELTATKSGTDIISLGKDVAPAPLQVKVEGGLLEAKQLVTNGDFSDDLSGWTSQGTGDITVNNIITYTPEFQYSRIQQNIDVPKGKYYYLSKIKTNKSTVCVRFYDSVGVPMTKYHSGSGNFEIVGDIFELENDSLRIETGREDGTSNFSLIEIEFAYLFNISTLIVNKQYSPIFNTTFDLMNDEQIKAQMDLWVQNGTLPNDNVLAVSMNKRVRSVGRNLFDGEIFSDKYYNSGTGALVDSPNINYKYSLVYIPVLPSTNYTISIDGYTFNTWADMAMYDADRNIITSYHQHSNGTFTTTAQTRYVRVSWIDLTNVGLIQLEQGTVTTSYVPYVNTDLYLQANKVGYKLPNGVADTIEYRNGKYYYVQRVQRYVLQSGDLEALTIKTTVDEVYTKVFVTTFLPASSTLPTHFIAVGKLNIDYNSSDNVTYIGYATMTGSSGRIRFILTKGTTLAQAQTALAGTVVYYQLATPIETEILALGNAQGLVGGTVYIDDVMADSNLYTHRYDIENTAYPIKSLDRIVKINADGSQTELAVSSAIIAGDGLSFTHPSLVANDIVWVSYAYNVANLFKSNTFVTYYDNPFIAVQPNGTPRRIVFAVDDSGVVTVSSQSV